MNAQPEPVDDRTHAEALHVLQDIQENIRETKRSQWSTTNYAALLYVAFVAALQLFSDHGTLTNVHKIIVTFAAGLVAIAWAGLILWLERDLLCRRCAARRIQRDLFTEQMKAYLGDLTTCGSTVFKDAGRDLPVLFAMALVSLGGSGLTIWLTWTYRAASTMQ